MELLWHLDGDPDEQEPWGRTLEWNGYKAMVEFFSRVWPQEIGENCPPITLFMRADEQIAAAHGRSTYVFERFQELVRARLPDWEIGWHCHLARQASSGWPSQEAHDEAWIAEVIERTGEDLAKMGLRGLPLKMGWCFHNNASVRAAEVAGVRRDFSALPGALWRGASRQGAAENVYDWRGTPCWPYEPDPVDYRRPAGGAARRSIVMYPLTTVRMRGFRVALYCLRRALDGRGGRVTSALHMPLALEVRDRELDAYMTALCEPGIAPYLTWYQHTGAFRDPGFREMLLQKWRRIRRAYPMLRPVGASGLTGTRVSATGPGAEQ